MYDDWLGYPLSQNQLLYKNLFLQISWAVGEFVKTALPYSTKTRLLGKLLYFRQLTLPIFSGAFRVNPHRKIFIIKTAILSPGYIY